MILWHGPSSGGVLPPREPLGFRWGSLVARLLHPNQVTVIEALRWIGEPLTAKDLEEICEVPRIQSAVKRLQELEAVEAERQDPFGGETAALVYQLAAEAAT